MLPRHWRTVRGEKERKRATPCEQRHAALYNATASRPYSELRLRSAPLAPGQRETQPMQRATCRRCTTCLVRERASIYPAWKPIDAGRISLAVCLCAWKTIFYQSGIVNGPPVTYTPPSASNSQLLELFAISKLSSAEEMRERTVLTVDGNAYGAFETSKARQRASACANRSNAHRAIFQTIFYRLPHRVWIYLHR